MKTNCVVIHGTAEEINAKIESFIATHELQGVLVEWNVSSPSIVINRFDQLVVAVTLTWVTDLSKTIGQ